MDYAELLESVTREETHCRDFYADPTQVGYNWNNINLYLVLEHAQSGGRFFSDELYVRAQEYRKAKHSVQDRLHEAAVKPFAASMKSRTNGRYLQDSWLSKISGLDDLISMGLLVDPDLSAYSSLSRELLTTTFAAERNTSFELALGIYKDWIPEIESKLVAL